MYVDGLHDRDCGCEECGGRQLSGFWDFLTQTTETVVSKLPSRTTTYPTYTPPYVEAGYYPEAPAPNSLTTGAVNWLPWALGAAGLLLLARRR